MSLFLLYTELHKNIFRSQCEYLYCVFKNRYASNAGFAMLRFDAWDAAARDKRKKNKLQTGMKICHLAAFITNELNNFSWESGVSECLQEQPHLTTFLTKQLSKFSLCPWTAITTVSKCETNLQLFNHLNIFLIDLWGPVCGLILFLTHSKPTQWGDVRCFSDVRCIILPNSSQVILQKLFEEPLIIWSQIKLVRNVPHCAQSVVWWSYRELMRRSN